MSSGGGSGSSNYNSSGSPGKKKKVLAGDSTSNDVRAIPVIHVAPGDTECSIDVNRHSHAGSQQQYPTPGVMKSAPPSCSSTATSRSSAVITPVASGTTPIEVGRKRSRMNGRKPYWRRRMEQFDQENECDAASLTGDGTTGQPMASSLSADQPVVAFQRPPAAPALHDGCIASLPLSIQVGFRRKMFSVFALQLLVVTGLMVALTYDTGLSSLMEKGFQHTSWYLLGTLAVMVVFLVLLYLGHAVFPINWIILAAFSVALSVFVSSVQVYLDTNAGLFCCGFTFLAVMIMIPLSGVERRVQRADGGDERALLGTTKAGFIAYLAVTLAAVVLFGVFGDRFVYSRTAFILSIVLEFALILWFSYDASTMYSIMSPDEYMSGVIFFYTDLLAVVVIVVIFGALALLFSSAGMGAGGFGGSCDCFGCLRVGRVFSDSGTDGGDGTGAAGSPVMPVTDSGSGGRRESRNAAVVPEEMVRS